MPSGSEIEGKMQDVLAKAEHVASEKKCRSMIVHMNEWLYVRCKLVKHVYAFATHFLTTPDI